MMFKIVENGDGSTSVFDKESGRLLCRVPKKSSAVAVGKPLVRQDVKPVIVVKHKDLKRCSPSLPKEYSPVEKKKRIEAWADCASTSDKNSFVSTSGSESSDDIADDCVDQYSFLKAFDLIDSSEVQRKNMADLRRTFPRRKISRVGPLLPSAPQSSVLRTFDDVELCSPLGMRFCHLRHRLSPTAVEQAAKKYDKYCKISVLTPHPNLTLRQRESVKYGITFRPTRSRTGLMSSTHTYSFTSRERRERYKQLVTGLNRRSRALRKCCKTLKVRIRRLTPREIKRYTARRSRPAHLGPATVSRICDKGASSDDDCVVIAEVIRTVPSTDGLPSRSQQENRSMPVESNRSSLMARAYRILDAVTHRLSAMVSLSRE